MRSESYGAMRAYRCRVLHVLMLALRPPCWCAIRGALLFAICASLRLRQDDARCRRHYRFACSCHFCLYARITLVVLFLLSRAVAFFRLFERAPRKAYEATSLMSICARTPVMRFHVATKIYMLCSYCFATLRYMLLMPLLMPYAISFAHVTIFERYAQPSPLWITLLLLFPCWCLSADVDADTRAILLIVWCYYFFYIAIPAVADLCLIWYFTCDYYLMFSYILLPLAVLRLPSDYYTMFAARAWWCAPLMTLRWFIRVIWRHKRRAYAMICRFRCARDDDLLDMPRVCFMARYITTMPRHAFHYFVSALLFLRLRAVMFTADACLAVAWWREQKMIARYVSLMMSVLRARSAEARTMQNKSAMIDAHAYDAHGDVFTLFWYCFCSFMLMLRCLIPDAIIAAEMSAFISMPRAAACLMFRHLSCHVWCLCRFFFLLLLICFSFWLRHYFYITIDILIFCYSSVFHPSLRPRFAAWFFFFECCFDFITRLIRWYYWFWCCLFMPGFFLLRWWCSSLPSLFRRSPFRLFMLIDFHMFAACLICLFHFLLSATRHTMRVSDWYVLLFIAIILIHAIIHFRLHYAWYDYASLMIFIHCYYCFAIIACLPPDAVHLLMTPICFFFTLFACRALLFAADASLRR